MDKKAKIHLTNEEMRKNLKAILIWSIMRLN